MISREVEAKLKVLMPAPGEHRDHTVVLDTVQRRALVFGGAEDSKRALNDTWALTLP